MPVPTVALSFAITVAHVSAVPFQVPRLKPMVTVESGARLAMVARIAPELVTLKGCVMPPFCVSVPVNVSVTGLLGCEGTAGLMSSEHAACPSASARMTAGNSFVDMVSIRIYHVDAGPGSMVCQHDERRTAGDGWRTSNDGES